jgi:tetratricopeptide (TPR) repeat protein
MNEGQSDSPISTGSTGASHVIAGFRYQLLHSIATLIALGENEILTLEVSEDFSVIAQGRVTDHQVKNSQAAAGPPSYSLQSRPVRQCLARFWEASSVGSAERRLVFMARGGAAVERDLTFPGGQAGLLYWQSAAVDADTTPIRDALSSLFAEHPLGAWLATNPSDAELRENLLRRVNWQLELLSANELAVQISDQLRPLFRERRWPVSLADQAMRLLLDRAFDVASKPQAADRHLNRLDLQEIVETTGARAWLADQFAQPVTDASSAQDILVSQLDVVTAGALRAATVEQLLADVRGQPLVWLHGTHGVGKSILAKLMAHRTSDRWLVVDLRPVRNYEASALAAWRELLRVSAGQPLDGIIIDDFVGEAARVLASRLAALARTLAPRGTRIIVTSHQPPSPVHLANAGSTANASIQAPYFSKGDIAELVALAPAPPAEMIEGWSAMLYVTTGGGHPVLVTAKLASLRARNWPNVALIEDFGTAPSAAVKLTRDEARRNLLASLRELDEVRSLEAGQLLRRAGSVFDRLDDALLLKLAAAEPPLRNAGDAIAVLKGAWLEILAHDDVRISPLIADITNDVPAADLKAWRRLAALHWIENHTLNERTLPLCFWNAYWGEHDSVLLELCGVMQTMDPEKLSAAAPILAPLSFLRTDGPIYQSHPVVGLYLRFLQFEIADAVDKPDIAGKVAERFLVEIDSAGEPGTLLLTATGARILMSASADIGPALRMDYALRIRRAYPLVQSMSEGVIKEPLALLPPRFRPDMDFADFLFSTVVSHIKGSEDQLAAIETLDRLEPAVRNRFIDAMGAIYDGPAVFVNSGWSHDQIENRDMRPALGIYATIQKIADSWCRPDVMAEIWCARSVILDEGLDDKEAALAAIDNAIKDLGALPTLIRQKVKMLAHLDRNHEATDLLLGIEDTIGAGTSLERGLALRDGGIAAAKAGRLLDAIRLFDKAHEALVKNPDNAPLAAGVLIEKALAQWRGGKRPEAVITAADAFDAVEQFEPTASRQAERSHQFARGMVGLMFMEPQPTEAPYTPPFTFGQASQLELSSAKLIGAALKPLSDNWRLLAAVEAEIGGRLGIDARSMAKQTGPLHLNVERLILAHRYASAVKSGAIGEALRVGAKLVATGRLTASVSPEVEGDQRVAPEALQVAAPSDLLADARLSDAIQSLILDTFTVQVLAGRFDAQTLEALLAETRAVFGTQRQLDQIFDSASQFYAVGPDAAGAEMLANGIAIASSAVEGEPSRRYHRDMMLIMHVIHSQAARAVLEPGAAKIIATGWASVLEHQRFLLKNPSIAASGIEEAINSADPPNLASAAALLLAARYTVTHHFGEGWFDTLKSVAAKSSKPTTSPYKAAS